MRVLLLWLFLVAMPAWAAAIDPQQLVDDAVAAGGVGGEDLEPSEGLVGPHFDAVAVGADEPGPRGSPGGWRRAPCR